MILKLYIIIFPENRLIPLCCPYSLIIITVHQSSRYFSCKTSRHGYKTLVILFKKLVVNSRLAVKALCPCHRIKLQKIFIACFIFAKKDEMSVLSVKLRIPVVSSAGRDIYLTSYDRLDSLCFCSFIKFNNSVHITVICYCNACLTKFLCFFYQLRYFTCTIKQAVNRMYV